jgi:hypothetical protein
MADLSCKKIVSKPCIIIFEDRTSHVCMRELAAWLIMKHPLPFLKLDGRESCIFFSTENQQLSRCIIQCCCVCLAAQFPHNLRCVPSELYAVPDQCCALP